MARPSNIRATQFSDDRFRANDSLKVEVTHRICRSRDILLGCNRRYIAHLSALDDFSAGFRTLGRLTRPREVDGKTVQGINFFAPADKALLHALQYPRVNIAGIRRSQLLPHLGMFSPTRLSRHLRRLLDLGVIKRVTGTYRYYLTKAGRAATAAAERITEAVIVSAMI